MAAMLEELHLPNTIAANEILGNSSYTTWPHDMDHENVEKQPTKDQTVLFFKISHLSTILILPLKRLSFGH
jgi:hypothetical protein